MSFIFHFVASQDVALLTINLIHAYLQKHVDDRNSRDNQRGKKEKYESTICVSYVTIPVEKLLCRNYAGSSES
jgi:hypothetical protein